MASACLAGLAAQHRASEVEVVVVGDVAGVIVPAGLATTSIPLADLHTNLRRDTAIRLLSTPLIALLDDDTVPQPGWLDAALTVDPCASIIVTGPEHAFLHHPTAQLIEAVSSSILTEGSLAHRVETRREVGWTDVPFSNVVLPRHVIETAGGLALDQPADIDDLEFMLRARCTATFLNDPALLVVHDRYPASIADLLRYRWRVRRRVGEKLVTHPWLYWRIPPAVVVATAPTTGLVALRLLGSKRTLGLGSTLYGAILGAQAVIGLRRVGLRRTPAFVGLTVALHIVNITAVQVGIIKALVGRAGTGRYDGRDTDWTPQNQTPTPVKTS